MVFMSDGEKRLMPITKAIKYTTIGIVYEILVALVITIQ